MPAIPLKPAAGEKSRSAVARPTLNSHRKFLRLARVLGSDVLARGHLEICWDGTYQSGDDYLGTSQDVESAAHWAGEPGLLTKALLEAGGESNAGFIEEVPDRPGHFRIHDLFENAPDYVQKRRQRELNRKARGVTLSDLRREAGKRGRATQFPQQPSGQLPASGGDLQANVCQLHANGETPAPAPAPAQKDQTLTSKPENGFDQLVLGAEFRSELKLDQALEIVWAYYIAELHRHPKLYSWTQKRRSMGKARLRELWKKSGSLESAIAVMKICIDRLKQDPWRNGANDRGKKYRDWEHLFRSTEQMEIWLDDESFAPGAANGKGSNFERERLQRCS
jgi:hypothetical protein